MQLCRISATLNLCCGSQIIFVILMDFIALVFVWAASYQATYHYFSSEKNRNFVALFAIYMTTLATIIPLGKIFYITNTSDNAAKEVFNPHRLLFLHLSLLKFQNFIIVSKANETSEIVHRIGAQTSDMEINLEVQIFYFSSTFHKTILELTILFFIFFQSQTQQFALQITYCSFKFSGYKCFVLDNNFFYEV